MMSGGFRGLAFLRILRQWLIRAPLTFCGAPLLRSELVRATTAGRVQTLCRAFALLPLLAVPTLATADCRQALVLGLDVSGSVDSAEYRLQIDGLAGALSDPLVRDTILMMPAAPVDLLVFEWSGPFGPRLVVPWTTLDATGLATVIQDLRRTDRGTGDPSTAIGAALRAGFSYLDDRSTCWKRTLDLSGDGPSNTGPHPDTIIKPSDVTVNGLVIGDPANTDPTGPLADFYRAYVISGADAFVEEAQGFEDFQRAMTRKLLRELQGLVLSRN